jgi:hypothetical protein
MSITTIKWRNEKYQYHREEGPARIVKRNGKVIINEWFINGERHRDKYPAVENYFSDIEDNYYYDKETDLKISNGIMKWYKHGILHRDTDNPSVVNINTLVKNYEYHYIGQVHRLLGPAKITIIDDAKYETFYINNNFIPSNEFYKIVFLVKKFIRKIRFSIYKKYNNILLEHFPYYHAITSLITKV